MTAPGPAPGRHVSVGEFVALPFVLAFLLFVIQAHLHDVWGIVWSAVFLIVVVTIGGAALWDLARGRRGAERDQLARAYAVAALIGIGLLPLAGWALVVLGHQPVGVLLPLLPAAVIGAVLGVAELKRRVARR